MYGLEIHLINWTLLSKVFNGTFQKFKENVYIYFCFRFGSINMSYDTLNELDFDSP